MLAEMEAVNILAAELGAVGEADTGQNSELEWLSGSWLETTTATSVLALRQGLAGDITYHGEGHLQIDQVQDGHRNGAGRWGELEP